MPFLLKIDSPMNPHGKAKFILKPATILGLFTGLSNPGLKHCGYLQRLEYINIVLY